jgi:hypothetical protein
LHRLFSSKTETLQRLLHLVASCVENNTIATQIESRNQKLITLKKSILACKQTVNIDIIFYLFFKSLMTNGVCELRGETAKIVIQHTQIECAK